MQEATARGDEHQHEGAQQLREQPAVREARIIELTSRSELEHPKMPRALGVVRREGHALMVGNGGHRMSVPLTRHDRLLGGRASGQRIARLPSMIFGGLRGRSSKADNELEGLHVAQPVVHFEIIGKDPENLREYYASLFGWEFDTPSPVAPEVSEPDNYGF